jgi:tetratricopeptide (TPR) repeat protein
MEEVGRLLDRALLGRGGLLVFSGPEGSGKTAVAEAAAGQARRRGLRVLWASPAAGQPGRLAWAQLLRDTGAPAGLVAGLLSDGAGPLELDRAARHLASGPPRLIVVDDADRGGPDALGMLSVVAARCAAAPVAVIATAAGPLGLRPELRLGALSERELAAALGGMGPELARALWLASRGLPGVALRLARELDGLGGHDDPVVHLALGAKPATPFLAVDTDLIRLLELARGRAAGAGARARVLAKLARELLGDASAAARRRALADEALRLARAAGDPGLLAEVLDARLHALWDPQGAEDRLAAGTEIIDLARAAGDGRRERLGMFWRFVALMELGRVPEAESALAAFAREAATSGDAEAAVMATARHAMLAILRGRFEEAGRLTAEVRQSAARIGMADAELVADTLAGTMAFERGAAEEEWRRTVDMTLASARERPGHLLEALAARVLAVIGRHDEAAAELDRLLPRALASPGPRWVGAMTDLAFVAAAGGHADAAAQIYAALAPYRQRLAVWGGAVVAWGPVSHHLGLLAAAMGRTDDAVRDFEEAIGLEQRIGALPYLAHSLAGLADALEASGDAVRASAVRSRSREIAQRLGMAALLDRLGPGAGEWALVRDGDDWLLTAGRERARLRDVRGLHYLRALLAAPGRDIRCLDLVAGGSGVAPAGLGPVLDAAARGAYRRRLGAVTAAIEAADRAGDREAAERAEDERRALLRELRGAAGLGGRPRQVAPEAERARVNVTRTLRAAIDRIAAAAPGAAAHLRASVRTGGCCRYDPAPGGPQRWRV